MGKGKPSLGTTPARCHESNIFLERFPAKPAAPTPRPWQVNQRLCASAITFLQVLTSAMAAFAFAGLEWHWRERVFFLYLQGA